MAKRSEKPRRMPGPNGLMLSAPSFTVYPSAAQVKVVPFYAEEGVNLVVPRYAAQSFRLVFGGSLAEVPTAEQPILDGSGVQAIAFDSNNDRNTDSFFFSEYTLKYPTIKAFGLLFSDVEIRLKDLSNHPTLLQREGLSGGSWLGRISVSANQLSFSSLPALTLSPSSTGSSALQATYTLATGDLTADLGQLNYTSADTALSIANTKLTISNSSKDITLSGVGSLSLPRFGLTGLQGSLDLEVANEVLKRVHATIHATTPLGRLGLAGKLSVEQNFSTSTGSIAITDGSIAGVGFSGNLNYRNAGDPATDLITGQLSFDNQVARKPLRLGWPGASSFGLDLVPLAGNIEYLYRPLGAADEGGHISFKDMRFDIITGKTSASFQGNLVLSLDANGGVSVQDMNLSLLKDATLQSDVFGTLSIQKPNPDTPAMFTLKRVPRTPDGPSDLIPEFDGRITYESPGSGLLFEASGLAYEIAPYTDPPVYGWAVKDATILIG